MEMLFSDHVEFPSQVFVTYYVAKVDYIYIFCNHLCLLDPKGVQKHTCIVMSVSLPPCIKCERTTTE